MNEQLIQIGSSVQFDCKSQHAKCKAKCCGTIEFTTEFWEKNQDKIITKPTDIIPFPNGSDVMPITESGYCPFLKEDYSCNVYEDRPDICRNYGNETAVYLSCPYLKKDGMPRSRQQRRNIQRKVDKHLQSSSKKLNSWID